LLLKGQKKVKHLTLRALIIHNGRHKPV
jgi:hypothetical protein